MINSQTRPSQDSVWVNAHQNSKGKWIRGYWRTPPKVVIVKGHFRNLAYIKAHKRRRPQRLSPADLYLAGQPESVQHMIINILKDVEPIMGY